MQKNSILSTAFRRVNRAAKQMPWDRFLRSVLEQPETVYDREWRFDFEWLEPEQNLHEAVIGKLQEL